MWKCLHISVIASGVSRRILVADAGQAIFLTETAYLHMKTNLLAMILMVARVAGLGYGLK
jgi:hypothetical protein